MRGLPATVGSEGAMNCDLRTGVVGRPRELAKLGRRSIGGIDGAFVEVAVPKVLVEPWLMVRFSGLLRKAIYPECALIMFSIS